MSLFCCVIPFYNGGSTIARALDSVFAGTVCGEVVVVCDGSSESLRPYLGVAHLAQERAGRLRVVEMRTNLGQGGARNIGVALSLSPLVCFLDQDDECLPGFHESCVEFLLDKPDVGAVEVEAEFVQDGRVVLEAPDPRYELALESVPWNLLIRRTSFWACGGFPVDPVFRSPAAGEDIAFRQAVRLSQRSVRLPVKGVRHHVREGSATDRFLRRSEVEQGQVRFLSAYPAETDGSLGRALQCHLDRCLIGIKDVRAAIRST